VDRSRVAPELRGRLRLLRRMPPVERAWGLRLSRTATALMPAARTPGVTIERPVPGVPGVRMYRPARRASTAALLWIHGGGMIQGRAIQDDRICGATAARLGIVVVSAEYRLAPEHPFPVPLDDCRTAWTWLRDHASELGVDPGRVAVGGESAGGGLAAALAQRLHDEGGQPAAQWLLCPMLDDRTAARHDLDAVRHYVWNNRANRFGWRSYLGTRPGAPEPPPYAVPARRDDLAGLPPAWIGVGDIDLFYDEDRAYAERLRAAGVPVTFHSVPGGPHGFEAWAPSSTIARTFIATAHDWLRTALGDDPSPVLPGQRCDPTGSDPVRHP
jgi:acetyl esterase/lipase